MGILILLEEGFEEIEALTVVDILRRAELPTKMVSATNSEYVTGAHNITVKTDSKLNAVSEYDMVILPGGYPGYENLEKNDAVRKLLNDAINSKKYVAAICGAPTVLGKLGYLKGKKACCYPSMENMLIDAEVSFDKVVHDGTIITSRGAGTAHDFAFKIVEILKDKSTADKLRKSMVY